MIKCFICGLAIVTEIAFYMCIAFSHSVLMYVIHIFLLSSLSSKTVLHFSMSQLVTVRPAICEANEFFHYDMNIFIHLCASVYL